MEMMTVTKIMSDSKKKSYLISTIYNLFIALRPLQWTKNLFILIPLIFAKKIFHYPSALKSLGGIFIFSLLASSIYLINDMGDLVSDRRHPIKRYRPLAAGLISPRIAKTTVALLLPLSLLFGYFMSQGFFLILACYAAIHCFYTYRLKHVVILDVFCISAGFFLRVIAGGVIINVTLSSWLIICSILISMFLALTKRRQEMVFLGESEAKNHRMILSEYSISLLDQMIGIITASTLLSYMLYCISRETIERFKTDHLIYTFPFVLYGIFRYLYLIHKKNQGGSPEKLLFSDPPLLMSVILWGGFCLLIIYRII